MAYHTMNRRYMIGATIIAYIIELVIAIAVSDVGIVF